MFHNLLPHWMDLSTWEDLWTSALITAAFTIPAIIASHRKIKRHISDKHDVMQDLLNPDTPGGLGEIGHSGQEDFSSDGLTAGSG